MRRSVRIHTYIHITFSAVLSVCDNYSSFDTAFPVGEINSIIKKCIFFTEEITEMWKFRQQLILRPK